MYVDDVGVAMATAIMRDVAAVADLDVAPLETVGAVATGGGGGENGASLRQ